MAKLPLAILGLILGLIALVIGWMGYGGFIFGIPAIVLSALAYKKGAKVLGILGILFASIGVVETIVMAGFVVPTIEEFAEKMEKEITPTTLTGKIGESVNLNGISLKVNSIKTSDVFIGKAFGEYTAYPAKSGYQFVIVDVTLTNVGVKAETPNLWNISIITDKGYIYEEMDISSIILEESRTSRDATPTEIETLYCEPINMLKGILPEEARKECFFFEIPSTLKPVKLNFETGISPPKLVSIELKP